MKQLAQQFALPTSAGSNFRRSLVAGGLTAMTLASGQVHASYAQSYVDVYAPSGSSFSVVGVFPTDPVRGSGAVTLGLLKSSAAATADLSSGIMKLGVTSKADIWAPPYVYNSYADNLQAFVEMGDDVTYHGATPGQTATLYFSIDGTFSGVAPVSASWGAYALYRQYVHISGASPATFVNQVAFNSGDSPFFACAYLPASDACFTGHNPAPYFYSITFPLVNDVKTSFTSSLQIHDQGAFVDFSNTAKMYVSLPDNVTFTSGSGSFLANALPLAPVSEPGELAMLLAGLGLIGAMARRRI